MKTVNEIVDWFDPACAACAKTREHLEGLTAVEFHHFYTAMIAELIKRYPGAAGIVDAVNKEFMENPKLATERAVAEQIESRQRGGRVS